VACTAVAVMPKVAYPDNRDVTRSHVSRMTYLTALDLGRLRPHLSRGEAHDSIRYCWDLPGRRRAGGAYWPAGELGRGHPPRAPVSDYGVLGGGALRITPASRPPGLSLTGEIDEFTYGDLVGALERLTAAPGEIHVDLAGVEYCDLVGLRAIVGLTGPNGQDHRRCVVMHNVPPRLRTVLGIVGWDLTPGLTITGAGAPARASAAAQLRRSRWRSRGRGRKAAGSGSGRPSAVP